jgi:hypothetical protein
MTSVPSRPTRTRFGFLPRFSNEIAYTAPATSASRPNGAKTVPRIMRSSACDVNVGSQFSARSQAMPFRASATGSWSTITTGRASGAPAPSR